MTTRRFAALWLPLTLVAVTAPAQGQGYFLSQTFDDPATAGDSFGRSVAVSGDHVLVGAYRDDTNGSVAGQAHLFDATTGNLLHTFNDPSPGAGDLFGYSVAVAGDHVLVGAYGDGVNGNAAGQAHLFDATTGNLLQTFNNPSPATGDSFGYSVAVAVDHVLIGAYGDDTNGLGAGQAHLFDATTGNLLQTFNDPSPATNDAFAWSTAISNERVLIGAIGDDTNGDNAGQAFLFDATTGNLLQTFNDPSPAADDGFGWSTAIAGDRVLIGAQGDDTNGINAGQAFLFDATTGDLLQTFNDPGSATHVGFGYSTAIAGDRVLIGAFQDDTNGDGAGRAHLFDATTGNLLQTFNDPGPAAGDLFGISVALAGDRAVIGASRDDTNGVDAGQAHLFTFSATSPSIVVDPDAIGATDVVTDPLGTPVALTNPVASPLSLPAEDLAVGNTAAGELRISGGATVSTASGSIGAAQAATGVATVTGAGSAWTNGGNLFVGNAGSGTLNIADGGVVSSFQGLLGQQAGSVGTATVDGGGSKLTVEATMYVGGLAGDGTLTVSGGGLVETLDGSVFHIARGSGRTGTVTVAGDGSAIDSSGELRVGSFGVGTLLVSDGGAVNSSEGRIGNESTASGTATVTGANSTWTNTGQLLIGNAGTGALVVEAGGSVASTSGNLGNGVDATGDATIADSGSEWILTNTLIVGSNGEGSLRIEDGATVTNTSGFLGNTASGVGTATATGAGSTWTNSGSLYVGNAGAGTLNVTSGGRVETTSGGAAFIAEQVGSTGSVTVSGAGSSLGTATDVVVGNRGSGTLTIEAGGTVSNRLGRIGQNAGATGVATVTGTGSSWSSSGDLVVGTDGAGTLIVEAGGAVTNTIGTIAADATATGTATITGAGSTWTSTGELLVGNEGDGTLSIEAGAKVQNTFGYLGFNAGSVGVATVSGAGSSWTNSGNINVGREGSGDLTVSAGGLVTNATGRIGSAASGVGAATVTGSGSQWNNTAALYVGGGSSASAGTATLTVADEGLVTSAGDLILWNTGTINLSGGAIHAQSFDNRDGGAFNFDHGALTVDGGTFDPGTLDYTLDGGMETATLRLVGGATAVIGDSGRVNQFRVGDTGAAALEVRGGSSLVSNANFNLGFAAGSTGSAIVSGAGTTWTHQNTRQFNVGVLGEGSLVIESGATVNGGAAIGTNAGGVGSAVVRDAGSTWNAQSISIGAGGQGTLDVENGASVAVQTAVGVGFSVGGDGTLTVRDAGSSLVASDLTTVGGRGVGTLNVEGGASFSSNVSVVGDQIDGTGTVNVVGAGSQWTESVAVQVGVDGSGTVHVNAGGRLTAAAIRAGIRDDGVGTVRVSGAGSELAASQVLRIGSAGAGSLVVENGGLGSVTGIARVGETAGGSGSVLVTGGDSSLSVDGPLSLGGTSSGGNGGTGSLTIADGGAVSVTGVTKLWDADETLSVDTASFSTGDLEVNGGTVTVQGAGALVAAAAGVRIGEEGSASLTVDPGATLTAGDFFYSGMLPGGSGDVAINGGVVTTNHLSVGGNAETVGGSSIVTIDGGGRLEATGFGQVFPGGTLRLVDGELALSTLTFTGSGGPQGPGAFEWTGGRFAVGTYYGDLTQTAGTLAAGASPGVTSITGNYTLDAGGTLEVELAGQGGVAGTDFDFYSVDGDATLNGGLIDVAPLAGFTDVIGQTYDVLTAANLTVDPSTVARLRPEFALSVEAGGNGSILRLTQVSLAAFDWTNPVGGGFQTSGNWSGATVPGADRPVRFDLPGETYTVAYTADATNPWARFEAGDVTLDLGGNTQTLTSTTSNAPSLFVASGATATVTGGTIAAQEVRSDGALTVSDGAEVTATSFSGGVTIDGGTLTTGSFTGSFVLNDGELAVVGGDYAGPSSIYALDGQQTGDHAILTLDGVGPETLYIARVGQSQKATLNIRGGSQVQLNTSYIGYGPESVGEVNVEGAGSVWDHFGSTVSIGYEGTGSLTIRDGAHADMNGYAVVTGNASGGAGEIAVEGQGSQLGGVATLYVGAAGTGAMTVRDAGYAEATATYIASGSSGAGVLSVEGVGSQYIGRGSTYIGSGGSGALAVGHGGYAEAIHTYVAYNSGSAGALAIDGVGSEYVSTGQLIVGYYGVGNASVSDGASFSTGAGGGWDSYIGFAAPASGRLTVSGAGSTWTAGRDVYVAGGTSPTDADGRLRVADGGVVDIARRLQVWSTGRIELAGGTINAETIDLASGSELSGHGSINATVNSSADVIVSGGLLSLSGPSVSLNGDTIVTSTGTLATSSFSPYTEVRGGAILASTATLDAGKVIDGYGIIVGDLTGPGVNLMTTSPTGTVDFRGALDVGAETATIYSQERPTINGSVSLAGGDLTTPTGSLLVAGSGSLSGHADLAGTEVLADLGSTIAASGGELAVGDAVSVRGFYSNGDLAAAAGATLSLHDANDAVLDSGAWVTLGDAAGDGALSAANGLTLDFGGNVTGRGVIDTPDDPTKPFTANGRISGESSANPITLTGHVKGVGVLDNVVIAGTDAPGFSPATVTRGSVSYGGTLEIEIGGTAAGSFDRVSHLFGAGEATLGGELDAKLINGFRPEAGDSFEFLLASGGVDGVFAEESLPELGGGLGFDLSYGARAVSLVVIGAAGDYNYDGIVDASDYTVWRDAEGAEGVGLAADGDGDGVVGQSDYDLWVANFGAVAASATAVPEPSSAVTAAALCLAGTLGRSRRVRHRPSSGDQLPR